MKNIHDAILDKAIAKAFGRHDVVPDSDTWSRMARHLPFVESTTSIPWFYSARNVIILCVSVSMAAFSIPFVSEAIGINISWLGFVIGYAVIVLLGILSPIIFRKFSRWKRRMPGRKNPKFNLAIKRNEKQPDASIQNSAEVSVTEEQELKNQLPVNILVVLLITSFISNSLLISSPYISLLSIGLIGLIFFYKQLTLYRISRGLLGNNEPEAKEIVSYILRKTEDQNFKNGNDKPSKVNPSQPRIEEIDLTAWAKNIINQQRGMVPT